MFGIALAELTVVLVALGASFAAVVAAVVVGTLLAYRLRARRQP